MTDFLDQVFDQLFGRIGRAASNEELVCPTCGSTLGFPISHVEQGDGSLPAIDWFCYPCLTAKLDALGVPRMIRQAKSMRGGK